MRRCSPLSRPDCSCCIVTFPAMEDSQSHRLERGGGMPLTQCPNNNFPSFIACYTSSVKRPNPLPELIPPFHPTRKCPVTLPPGLLLPWVEFDDVTDSHPARWDKLHVLTGLMKMPISVYDMNCVYKSRTVSVARKSRPFFAMLIFYMLIFICNIDTITSTQHIMQHNIISCYM